MFQPLERVSIDAVDLGFLMGSHNLCLMLLYFNGVMLCLDACKWLGIKQLAHFHLISLSRPP